MHVYICSTCVWLTILIADVLMRLLGTISGGVYMTRFHWKTAVSHRIGCSFTRIWWNSMQIPSKSARFCIQYSKLILQNRIARCDRFNAYLCKQQKRIRNWPTRHMSLEIITWQLAPIRILKGQLIMNTLAVFLLVFISNVLAAHELNIFLVFATELAYSREMNLMLTQHYLISSSSELVLRTHQSCHYQRAVWRYWRRKHTTPLNCAWAYHMV